MGSDWPDYDDFGEIASISIEEILLFFSNWTLLGRSTPYGVRLGPIMTILEFSGRLKKKIIAQYWVLKHLMGLVWVR